MGLLNRINNKLNGAIRELRVSLGPSRLQWLQAQREAADKYHVWYYETGVHTTVRYLGHETLKSVADMWNYQEILAELKPALVIEFGTNAGGSALFFAHTLAHITPDAPVLSVDIDHSRVPQSIKTHPGIELMTCSSTDPEVAERIRALRAEHPGPAFIILDSDHRMEHVLGELRLLRDVTQRGDYVVVEDSNVNGHPVQPGWGPGPWEARQAYLDEHPEDYVHDAARERKFGFTFATDGFLIRQ